MSRSAGAQWQGKLADGRGRLTTASRVLVDTPHSFATRFEGAAGTTRAQSSPVFKRYPLDSARIPGDACLRQGALQSLPCVCMFYRNWFAAAIPLHAKNVITS
jgi:hypothetical protein